MRKRKPIEVKTKYKKKTFNLDTLEINITEHTKIRQLGFIPDKKTLLIKE